MTFTGKLVLLAATALAWFVYAVAVDNPGGSTPLIVGLARASALVLSAAVVVWMLETIIVDGLVGAVWGIPPTGIGRFVVYLVLGVAAAVLVLKYGMDFNVVTLLTTSALITAVIGFAAQSTLAALFSGVVLQLGRHIQPGDIICVDGRLARVEVMGWRSMAARRGDGITVMVPNTTVAGNPLAIFRAGDFVRTELSIAAPIATPPGEIIEIITSALSNIAEVSLEHPIGVELDAMQLREGLASYRVRCFAPAETLEDNRLAPLIRLRVWYAFQRHGISAGEF